MNTLRHAAVETSLGPLLVALGDAGVREVTFGSSPESLLTAFEAANPESCLDPSLESLAAGISLLPSGGHDVLGEPLDLGGTPFQRLVWEGIRRIPRGRTATYAALAADIGMTSAVRAVASACGANRVAILVPCHRVVRSDGSPGGYRWGADRKRIILGLEAGRSVCSGLASVSDLCPA